MIVGVMMLVGSSAFGILNAVVLQNEGFVRNWYVPVRVGNTGVFSASVSLLAAGAYWVSGTQPKLRPYRKHAILVMQSIFVLAGLWFCFRNSAYSAIYIVKYLAPFCWLLLTSPDEDATPFRTARSGLALIGATMLLYAFPIGGTQVNIVAVLPLVVVAVLSRDVASALSRQWNSERLLVMDACRNDGLRVCDGRLCDARGYRDLPNRCRTGSAWHVVHSCRSPASGGPPMGEQPAVEMLRLLLHPWSSQLFIVDGTSVADDPERQRRTELSK